MSPIIHAAVGWLIAQKLERRRDRAVIAVAAVAPDLDGIGIVFGAQYYEEWHHKLAHGVLFAIVTTVACALLVKPRWAGALLGCLAFHSHVVMDLCGSGPGWPILYWWPWADTEWLPSWQWDLASWQNSTFGLVTIVLCLSMALVKGRTPVELFSLKADARVVETLRARFGKKTARMTDP